MVSDCWVGADGSKFTRRIATPCPAERATSLPQRRATTLHTSSRAPRNPPYISRYVAVDSHLVERKGSSDSVSSVAGERPAGRKFAQEIAAICNQLHGEGYEVFSLIPTVGGRIIEVFVDEDGSESQDQTQASPTDSVSDLLRTVAARPMTPDESTIEKYEPMAAGYSVTDGVIITAKLRT